METPGACSLRGFLFRRPDFPDGDRSSHGASAVHLDLPHSDPRGQILYAVITLHEAAHPFL